MINFDEIETEWINLFHELKRKYKERELEIIFSSITQNNSTPITRFSFINLLKHMKNTVNSGNKEWEKLEPTSSLDITLHKKNDIEDTEQISGIRITIEGGENISIYCKNNDISQIPSDFVHIMYKKSSSILLPEDYECLENSPTISDEAKKRSQNISNSSLSKDIENYGIKFTLKDEIYLNKMDKFEPYDNTYSKKLSIKANKIYSEYKNIKFKNYFKTFRLKNRYSFLSTTSNIRLDLTVVQTSYHARNNKGYTVAVPVKEFIDSRLLESEKKYEVELELFIDQTKIPDLISINQNKVIQKKIEFVLTNMNKYPFVISKQEENDIFNIFKLLIRNNLHTIAQKKLNILTNIKEIEKIKTFNLKKITEQQDEDKRNEIEKNNIKYNDIIQKIELECMKLNNIYYQKIIENKVDIRKQIDILNEYISNNNRYNKDNIYKISPKQVTLNIIHIQEHKNRLDSIINNNYTVTDKADGSGKYLYIVGTSHLNSDDQKSPFYIDKTSLAKYNNEYKGKIYLIDNNLKIYSTNLKIKETNLYDKYCKSLLNGEFIDKTIENKDTFNYIAYDIYFNTYKPDDHTTDTKKLPFMSHLSLTQDTRHNILKNFVENINNDIDFVDSSDSIDKLTLNISSKQFYLYNKDEDNSTIFKYSDTIWSKFKNSQSQYKYDGLIYTPADHPVGFDENNINFDLNTGKTWDLNLKWKPQHENTIDFLLKEEKDEIANYNNYKINQSNIKTQTVKIGN